MVINCKSSSFWFVYLYYLHVYLTVLYTVTNCRLIAMIGLLIAVVERSAMSSITMTVARCTRITNSLCWTCDQPWIRGKTAGIVWRWRGGAGDTVVKKQPPFSNKLQRKKSQWRVTHSSSLFLLKSQSVVAINSVQSTKTTEIQVSVVTPLHHKILAITRWQCCSSFPFNKKLSRTKITTTYNLKMPTNN